MFIGSHNTMTYLPPTKWWMYPFKWVYQTQSKSLKEQLYSGINLIDIRVRFDKDDRVVLCHGYYEAKTERLKIKDFVHKLLTNIIIFRYVNDVYVRIILETGRESNSQEVLFAALCRILQETAPEYITVFGGFRKFDWKKVTNCIPDIPIIQAVSSMMGDAKWYEKICPWLYAKRMNNKNKELYSKSNEIVLFDFI